MTQHSDSEELFTSEGSFLDERTIEGISNDGCSLHGEDVPGPEHSLPIFRGHGTDVGIVLGITLPSLLANMEQNAVWIQHAVFALQSAKSRPRITLRESGNESVGRKEV